MAFCSTSFNYFMNATWEKYAMIQDPSLKTEKTKLDSILMIAGTFEAISGLLAGGLLQKLPFKGYYIGQIVLQIIMTGTINYATESNYLNLVIYVSLSMYFLGSDKTVYPTITQKIFGPIAGPKLYPIVYMFFSFASIL